MDYVCYTSNATYWDRVNRNYTPPNVELLFYRGASNTAVLDDIFGCNDCFASLAFWLGAAAD